MNRGTLFERVLIANRGAIACRIARTLKRLDIASVAVYSDADRHSLHVTAADHAINIGEAPVAQSYLCVDRILAAAHASGAQAIHPGYGFLAENADFAERCEREGLVFIGPTPAQMRAFGLKHTARRIAEQSRVPLLPGSALLESLEDALQAARSIGYPVMLKSTAGGGGIGMQLCRDEHGLRDAFDAVRRLSRNHFADGGVFLEKFVERARHIEVQIFGDGAGQVIALGERDCSLQRRNQKVIEETPAPDLPATVRSAMLATAENLGRAMHYRSAGTVEYIYDADTGDFHFLEVNTRLQVEHGVTEEVSGIDLVEWMVRVAAGEPLDEAALRRPPHGHSIQARVYAEDPARDFQPSSGLLSEVRFPAFARVETWVEGGSEVSPWYDPMIAKIIVHGADRASALSLLERALAESRIAGIETNVEYLSQIVTDTEFVAGTHTTARLAGLRFHSAAIDVLSGGTQTTIQDWPGRSGYWHIGVPPSGPMDELAFRVGNRLLGNPDSAAGLEIAVSGPTLKFRDDTTIALTGAPLPATLDGEPVPLWQAVTVRPGQTLTLGRISAGARSYLLLHGGVEAPSYLGSRATFTLGQFGGHGGRTLRAGDVLHPAHGATGPAAVVLPGSVPDYDNTWTLRVVHGPHGAPDFFTATDIETFFSTHWRVHYNSSRTGVRLIGPKPQWAREDGGEAGLHPSNIHDNAYAIGTVDFTGDMPVILGPDGPSLGGFVCPATVIAADRWKLGQLAAGHAVRFVAVDIETAHRLRDAQNERLAAACIDVTPAKDGRVVDRRAPSSDSAVLQRRDTREHATGVTYRAAGDRYVLIEYGEMVLDLNLRFRIQALYEWLRGRDEPGMLELTPGVRSLQVHYAPEVLPLAQLMALLEQAEDELEDLSAAEVPSRIVHLPLVWDDSQTRLAISRYAQSVRADAPWCPSNIEFIRRINGLDSEEEVRRIVYDASYLVMGLGDVYLSAPVATPVDPRHRLVTTKYNPARTWTPENAVGIGGSYLCIYGMEGPGGYQFVGRTLQMWNRFHVTREFEQPWLLRFFDQIRFYPVEESELLEMREDFPRGRCHIDIEETTFSLARYNRFIAEHQSEISAFKARQQAAFEAERLRWAQAGTADPPPDDAIAPPDSTVTLNDGEAAVEGQVHGMVWKLAVSEGQQVRSGDPLLVLEFMKTELTMTAESSGRVSRILCREGALVTPGQTLLVIASQD
jgi:urea carboxylase